MSSECWITHIDASPRSAIEAAEDALNHWVTHHDRRRFGRPPIVLRQVVRPNHFEIVLLEAERDRCNEYNSSDAVMVARSALAPILAAPFDMRIYDQLGSTPWSVARSDEFAVLTSIELQHERLTDGVDLVGEYSDTQQRADGCMSQSLLQRRSRRGVFELLSAWTSPESFEAFGDERETEMLRAAIVPLLAAPIEDRRHHVLFGDETVNEPSTHGEQVLDR